MIKIQELMVVKRNGEVVDFSSLKILNAIVKAVKATNSKLTEDQIQKIVSEICKEIENRFIDFFPNVENIQDIVEKHLVKEGLYEISKAYILYRAKRQDARKEAEKDNYEKLKLGKLRVNQRDGTTNLFDISKIQESIKNASSNLSEEISVDLVIKELSGNIYDGITSDDLKKSLILSIVPLIEQDPIYSKLASNIFLSRLFREVTKESANNENYEQIYKSTFINKIKEGANNNIYSPKLLEFDLEKLANNLKLERDNLFEYTGIQTLYDRYFVKKGNLRLELPQIYWMRVAMGLAINEKNKDEKAIEFYNIIASLKYTPSTPTLFHSGLVKPQLSSCFLTTIKDDLSHIFKSFGDNAQLSKWSGGLGNDWTDVRATGSLVKSTNNESQGVIPFLKIANDTNIAINRTGRKRGATCAYLEVWHFDIEDFIDLRKNTGDDRRRTHDMNTAAWIPDLFIKRVLEDKDWTLFSPNEVPELHDLYGNKFEEKYIEYENNSEKLISRKIPAKKLWRKIISSLYETGHPWITFKDPSNIRSPQDHAGVIHSSNLCTEITLNTSEEETAVCNLGSVNLGNHIINHELDTTLLSNTVRTAIRMLDNVIDLNYYPTIEAKNSNLKHRPIGLGIMGLQDALFKLRIPFETEEALKFVDNTTEMISFSAIYASSEIAKEKGKYESYAGSKWDRGIFPLDTLDLLEKERGLEIETPRTKNLNWEKLKEFVKVNGMRNSNVMAIAPTATISTIAGCFPCIEPIYKNIYVKANMTGEFTIINKYLINDLKKVNIWNKEMLDQLKYYDGNLELIGSIPEDIKKLHKEVFEIDPEWLIKLTAIRGKWIDQSQSHNVFMKGDSGKKLNDIYLLAWKSGLKTTYYLRTLGATQIEKSTLDANKYGFTQKREYKQLEENKQDNVPASQIDNVCSILDPECEACQ